MPSSKSRLHADLNAAMKARDELTTATLRMALTAVTTEEVAGKQARELTDDEVLTVLAREAKKRREAAEAFDAAGRAELAERERAEGDVLDRYLPAQLDDAELAELVRARSPRRGASGPQQTGRGDEAGAAEGRRPGRRQAGQRRGAPPAVVTSPPASRDSPTQCGGGEWRVCEPPPSARGGRRVVLPAASASASDCRHWSFGRLACCVITETAVAWADDDRRARRRDAWPGVRDAAQRHRAGAFQIVALVELGHPEAL